LILVVLVVVGVLVVVFRHREREPEYGGKKLSEWVEQMASHIMAATDAGQATEAIAHIGTNGVPYLVKWLSYEKPSWKGKLASRIAKTFKKNPDAWLLRWDKAMGRAVGAEPALRSLGPEAEARIVQLLKDPDPRLRAAATNALRIIDPQALGMAKPPVGETGKQIFHSGACRKTERRAAPAGLRACLVGCTINMALLRSFPVD
jgi:hypothetical protein